MVAHGLDEIHVHYVVPVIAVVDRVTRTVSRVVVDDERVRFDDDKVRLGSGHGLSGAALLAVAAEAIGIAEDAAWPSWEFGW